MTTDEPKLRIEVDRGARAKTLLENELLVGAFEAIEAELRGSWLGTMDAGKREELWQEAQALRRVRGKLQAHVQTGKMAAQQLADAEAKKTRQRR